MRHISAGSLFCGVHAERAQRLRCRRGAQSPYSEDVVWLVQHIAYISVWSNSQTRGVCLQQEQAARAGRYLRLAEQLFEAQLRWAAQNPRNYLIDQPRCRSLAAHWH